MPDVDVSTLDQLSPDEKVKRRIIDHLRALDGRLKTFMEAITEYDEQMKARKDMVSNMVWQDAFFLYESIKKLLEED